MRYLASFIILSVLGGYMIWRLMLPPRPRASEPHLRVRPERGGRKGRGALDDYQRHIDRQGRPASMRVVYLRRKR